MWYKHILRNVWRDFRLSMSALAMVAGKSFNGKFTAKTDFPSGYFYVAITDADSGSLKFLHTLFESVWTTCWCNFNKIVWSKHIYKIVNFMT